jgi:hypothetical protein
MIDVAHRGRAGLPKLANCLGAHFLWAGAIALIKKKAGRFGGRRLSPGWARS